MFMKWRWVKTEIKTKNFVVAGLHNKIENNIKVFIKNLICIMFRNRINKIYDT
jgi:hypothetical protein